MDKPGWRTPMLATLTEERFSSPEWLFERKLDGVRAIGARDGETVRLWSRNEKPMEASYPEIAEALATQQASRYVVDGEIVAFQHDQTSFAALQPRFQLTDPARIAATGVRVYYYLFDLLHWDGVDVTDRPLRERKQLLREAFDFTDPLRLSEHQDTEGERFFEHARAHGWEGLVAKRAAGRYHGGRSSDWLKFKCVKGQEFVVGGFTDPAGSRKGFGALLLGYHADGELRYAGKVGTGYSEKVLRQLRDRLDPLLRDDTPFVDPVRERGRHWVSPELVVQVVFTEWTRDGRLRHPRFVGLREDKDPADVIREQN